MEALVGVAVVYLIVGILWSRIYFARRHGVGWGVDISAAVIGLAWPVTLFVLWRPQLCQHRRHVLERAQFQSQYEAENAQIEQTLRRERR